MILRRPAATDTAREAANAAALPSVRAIALVGIVLASFVVVRVPYLIAGARHSSLVFSGLLWSPTDAAVYIAAMREGATNAGWLVHDHMPGEPHRPAFMFALYVATGKVAGAFGIGPSRAFALTLAVSQLALLSALVAFVCAVLPRQYRMAALLLAVFSSGTALILLADAALQSLGVPPDTLPKTGFVELNTLLLLFAAPHLQIGMACLLMAVLCYVRTWTRPAAGIQIIAIVSTLGVSFSNSFALVTLIVVVVTHLLVESARQRRIARGALLSAACICLTALPFLLYSEVVFARDPFWQATYGPVVPRGSPALPFLLLALGPTVAWRYRQEHADPGLGRRWAGNGQPAHWYSLPPGIRASSGSGGACCPNLRQLPHLAPSTANQAEGALARRRSSRSGRRAGGVAFPVLCDFAPYGDSGHRRCPAVWPLSAGRFAPRRACHCRPHAAR